jgi:hypothetical protein
MPESVSLCLLVSISVSCSRAVTLYLPNLQRKNRRERREKENKKRGIRRGEYRREGSWKPRRKEAGREENGKDRKKGDRRICEFKNGRNKEKIEGTAGTNTRM